MSENEDRGTPVGVAGEMNQQSDQKFEADAAFKNNMLAVVDEVKQMIVDGKMKSLGFCGMDETGVPHTVALASTPADLVQLIGAGQLLNDTMVSKLRPPPQIQMMAIPLGREGLPGEQPLDAGLAKN